MNTFEWEDGTITERPYVEIDSVKHYVQDPTISGGTPVSSTNLNEMQDILNDNIDTKISKGEVLFENSAGVSGSTITLSKNWANYSTIQIVYSKGHSVFIDVDYYTGLNIDLSYFWNDSTNAAGVFGAFYTLNNSGNLEYQYARRFYFYTWDEKPTIDTTNAISIYKVIGYK